MKRFFVLFLISNFCTIYTSEKTDVIEETSETRFEKQVIADILSGQHSDDIVFIRKPKDIKLPDDECGVVKVVRNILTAQRSLVLDKKAEERILETLKEYEAQDPKRIEPLTRFLRSSNPGVELIPGRPSEILSPAFQPLRVTGRRER